MDKEKYPIEISLPCCSKYTSLAFDGCTYYMLKTCSNNVYRFDCRFCEVSEIKTCRLYNTLCYDCKNCCFWASSAKCKGVIYKLDCGFREIDRFYVSVRGEVEGIITGLSYDCCKDEVLVAFACGIIAFSIKSECSRVVCKITDGIITGVLSITPYYMIIATHKNKQCIIVIDNEGNKIKREYIPHNCIVEDIIYCCCKDKGYFVSLIEKKGCYQKIYIDKAECLTLPHSIICCCYKHSDRCCCCDDKPHCDIDIIESIALIEASIAHILNAEGEKLQKILATTDDFHKIMHVNKEINQTIINATQLEQVLYQKLLCAKEIKPHPPCDEPCCDECDDDKKDISCDDC